MKRSLKTLALALVMVSGVQATFALDIAHPKNIEHTVPLTKEWTLAKEVDGVSVYYSIVKVDTERFLWLKFENTNAEAVDFIWSMTKNDNAVIITEDEMIESIVRLGAAETRVVDGNYLIELSDDEQLSDFTISIKPTKR